MCCAEKRKEKASFKWGNEKWRNFSRGNSSLSRLFALSRIYFCFPLIVIQMSFSGAVCCGGRFLKIRRKFWGLMNMRRGSEDYKQQTTDGQIHGTRVLGSWELLELMKVKVWTLLKGSWGLSSVASVLRKKSWSFSSLFLFATDFIVSLDPSSITQRICTYST